MVASTVLVWIGVVWLILGTIYLVMSAAYECAVAEPALLIGMVLGGIFIFICIASTVEQQQIRNQRYGINDGQSEYYNRDIVPHWAGRYRQLYC